MLKQQLVIAPLSILIVLTSSCLVAGQGRNEGLCPDMDYLDSMDLNAFKGSWYLQTGYSFGDIKKHRCQKTDYSCESGTEFSVRNFQISRKGGSQKVTKGSLTFIMGGLFFMTYDGAGASTSSSGSVGIDWKNLGYKVLRLDCDSLIIYACQNLPNSPSGKHHAELVWVYTRDAQPSLNVMGACKVDLSAKGIYLDRLESTIHDEECGFYGESATKFQKQLR
ncbi:uncharacterized protein [Eurosta solidaginis]|uniref:uncharacterized protein n=1 Tax=Eurosta solidaginis TaxID=178769 RepID=UPI0035314E4D